ncbi:hypothetical protein INS49_008551 [Diaporthe citri]|uniref:uncharacterized protein n=1 Tax=Diaporthe citri TaxID=83186 RepID=UPI001C813B2D|nr:uncharacterized protein INS49_008551 [Diaporthe citri]KAG6363451.1 hypothetical protein INS49_008551 [Diaporthe citri]
MAPDPDVIFKQTENSNPGIPESHIAPSFQERLIRSSEEARQKRTTSVTMCYTTVTHFNRCSHRASITTFCPRSTHLRPTIYHPPTRHARPCATNDRKGNIFVQRDELCGACRRVGSRCSGGGGGGPNGTRRNGAAAKGGRDPAAQTAGVPPSYYPCPGQGRAQPAYPIPTGAGGDGRCPLSAAFERVMSIGGDEDGRVEGSRWVHGGVGEGVGVDGSRTREHKGEYGPSRPPHFSSDADNGRRGLPGGDMPSWSGGYGGHAGRKARRTAGKKRVRFAPKVEVLYFRRDWATRTLRSLRREYKGRR